MRVLHSIVALGGLWALLGCGDSTGSGGSGAAGAGGAGQGGSPSAGADQGGEGPSGGQSAGGQSAGGQSAGGQSAGGQSAGGQNAGGAGGSSGGGFGDPCPNGNEDCVSGVCHNFPQQGGMLCTELCGQGLPECPPPSSGCNMMGYCKPN